MNRCLSTGEPAAQVNSMAILLNKPYNLIGSQVLNEPHCEKTGLRGCRPGPTQTSLYSHRRWLEA